MSTSKKKLKSFIAPIVYTLLFFAFLTGCSPLPSFNPKLYTYPTAKDLQSLPSAFAQLSSEEKSTSWGQELYAGKKFALQVDYYRAITCFYRSKFFLPFEERKRKEEIDYSLVLSYWLGGRPAEAVQAFEESSLPSNIQDFPAKKELLIALYQSYHSLGESENQTGIMRILSHYDEPLSHKLLLSNALLAGDLKEAKNLAENTPYTEIVSSLEKEYCRCRTSPSKAMIYNALLPGLGYLYVGQKQSAFTSFTINVLTTAASYYCFKKGNWGAGTLLASLEMGWYFGGIYGAGLEAQEYNERLYRQIATPVLTQNRLFPALLIGTSF